MTIERVPRIIEEASKIVARASEQAPVPEQSREVEISPYVVEMFEMERIDTLPQPRDILDDIPELADTIARKNLLQHLSVGRHTPESAIRYLADVNERWGTKYNLEDMKTSEEMGETFYYFLIAGHRRLAACNHLNTKGCSSCQEAYGEGGCYTAHFPRFETRVPIRIYDNPDYHKDAVDIQEMENLHMSVPPARQAFSYYNIFWSRKKLNPDLNVRDFARSLGKRTDVIMRAVKFCGLPEKFQKLVLKKKMDYGIGVELFRLYTYGAYDNINNLTKPDIVGDNLPLMDENTLMMWTMKAIAENKTVQKLRSEIDIYLVNREAGQLTFEEIHRMLTEEEKPKDRRPRAFDDEIAKGLGRYTHAVLQLRKMTEEGLVGTENSPFAVDDVVDLTLRVLKRHADLIPHLEEIAREYGKNPVKNKAQALTQALETVRISLDFADERDKVKDAQPALI